MEMFFSQGKNQNARFPVQVAFSKGTNLVPILECQRSNFGALPNNSFEMEFGRKQSCAERKCLDSKVLISTLRNFFRVGLAHQAPLHWPNFINFSRKKAFLSWMGSSSCCSALHIKASSKENVSTKLREKYETFVIVCYLRNHAVILSFI